MPTACKSKQQKRKEEKEARKKANQAQNLRKKNSEVVVRSLKFCAKFVQSGCIEKYFQGCCSYDMLWTRRVIRVKNFRRMARLVNEKLGNRFFDFPIDLSDSPKLHLRLCEKVRDAYAEAYAKDYRKQIVDEERPIVGTSKAEYLLHKSFCFMVLFLYDLPYAPFYDLDDSVLAVAPALRQCLSPYTCLQVATDLLLMYLEESGYFGSKSKVRNRCRRLCSIKNSPILAKFESSKLTRCFAVLRHCLAFRKKKTRGNCFRNLRCRGCWETCTPWD